jgi:hypothetical protein
MRDAKAAFFVGQYDCRRLDGVTLALGAGECPRFLKTVLQNQPMHITHVCIQRMIFDKGKWDSTDAG